MYAQQSIQDSLFLMLYGSVALLAVVAGLYLWLRRSNGIFPDITPPSSLRRWTAAFFLMAAMSHVWWYVLGIYWLTDDRLVRNITAVTLDHVLIVPLVMATMLRMLQDRRHLIWPWFLAQVPIIALAVVGIARRSEFYGFDLTTYWQVAVIIVFIAYYIYALIRYSCWLRENYADLEHKEVWQSLLFAAVLFGVYGLYFTNPGVMVREYLAQLETVVIISFLLWRVESLKSLSPGNLKKVHSPVEEGRDSSQTYPAENTNGKTNHSHLSERDTGGEAPDGKVSVPEALQLYCEQPRLYLQYDLTLSQLAETVGMSREALGAWFTGHDDNYNAYINRLRIDHFVSLYREAVANNRSFTVFGLAYECGYRSFLSFSTAFRKYKGIAVSAWIERAQI